MEDPNDTRGEPKGGLSRSRIAWQPSYKKKNKGVEKKNHNNGGGKISLKVLMIMLGVCQWSIRDERHHTLGRRCFGGAEREMVIRGRRFGKGLFGEEGRLERTRLKNGYRVTLIVRKALRSLKGRREDP